MHACLLVPVGGLRPLLGKETTSRAEDQSEWTFFRLSELRHFASPSLSQPAASRPPRFCPQPKGTDVLWALLMTGFLPPQHNFPQGCHVLPRRRDATSAKVNRKAEKKTPKGALFWSPW
ncbi:unnamed protein product [Protopolystoma xenopodis]|uniref:Uncharacterized protein n=1 Tax=Protopolystoma xenopodis TaxID=117903 RepID=A0A3S5B0M2_9PLAT|nr:unnamed protein product [Protopolystoma xenopodis]